MPGTNPRSEVSWAGGLRWSGSETGWLGLFASMTSGRVLLRHEMRFKEKSPEEAIEEIEAAMRRWRIPHLDYIAANPQLWPKKPDEGETVKETFELAGFAMMKGTTDRRNGFSRLRSWLVVRKWPDDEFAPSLTVHPDCRYFLRTFPTLRRSEEDPEDIENEPRSFPAEGAMHYAMSRPAPTPNIEEIGYPAGSVGELVQEVRDELARNRGRDRRLNW